MSIYDVTVTRGDGVWVVDISGLPSSYFPMTQVSRFDDLDLETRDLVAGLTDTDPWSFDLTWRIMFGDIDVTKTVRQLEEIEQRVRDLEEQRDLLRTELIHEGRNAELSQSTIAGVLHMSQQRVGQLARAGR